MIRGHDLGLSSCPTCELVVNVGRDVDRRRLCPRCATPLRIRTRRDRAHALALLIAATALYFPANMLTIVHTEQFPDQRDDTILSGVVYLWHRGSWDLAILVFAASITVPILKIVALGFLMLTSGRQSAWRPKFRTKLYHLLEVIGHWSMLDVFVVALLTAVVQLGRVARVSPGPAVLPFAGVVVLTMLASASFDPRAIWDFPARRGHRE
jgi:paraquat-inducible protein A